MATPITGEATESVADGRPDASTGPHGRWPGEPGLWVLLFGDLLQFTAFFGFFAFERSRHLAEFEQNRTALNVGQGVLGTVLLLTGSLFVAFAVHGLRRSDPGVPARRWFLLAAFCGVAFFVNKCVEYGVEISRGLTISSNDFFLFYYCFTAIHLAHVIVATSLLVAAARMVRRRRLTSRRFATVEGIGLFWHMVDLIWVALFALLYLM